MSEVHTTATESALCQARPGRMPEWLRRPVPRGPQVQHVRDVVDRWSLHTVCESARCPNRLECYSDGRVTFMLLGNVCTRSCAYCMVPCGRPLQPDGDEPHRIAGAAAELKLDYVVLTSVCRDDLAGGGAEHFAATVLACRKTSPNCMIEVLVPDFRGSKTALATVLASQPTVLNHNIETVKSLYPHVRRQGRYCRALELLDRAKRISPKTLTKSGLMLGLGETREEVMSTLHDLRQVRCDVVTLGQYVRPSLKHWPVDRYVTPEEFAEYEAIGKAAGFSIVASGPLVRSSFMAKSVFASATASITC